MQQELLPGCSREVFERVWKRVMPEARQDCPFEVALPEERPLPAVVTSAVPAVDREVETGEEEITCLGPASAVHGPQLQQYIDQELMAHRCCQAMARRVPGSGGRMLSALAAEKRRRAKRLSTAYFLISGVRYWPVAQLTRPRMTTYVGGLRQLYQRGQALTEEFHSCRSHAATQDLAQLYAQLAQAGAKRCAQLRQLLEQTHM